MRSASWLFRSQRYAAVLVLAGTVYGHAEQDSRPSPPRGVPTIQRDDDAKTVLAKAINAHGGADKLSRWSKGYIKYEASLGIIPPEFGKATLEDTFDLPGHFKRVIHGKMGDEELTVITVHNNGKGWIKRKNAEAEPNESNFTERPEHLFAYLCDFSKVCGGKAKLSRLSDEKFANHDAAVIKARSPEGVDVDVFIDNQSGYVIGTRKRQEVLGSKDPISMIVVLDSHKTFQKGVYPTKIKGLRDDMPLLEVTILELKFLDKVDAAEFAKP